MPPSSTPFISSIIISAHRLLPQRIFYFSPLEELADRYTPLPSPMVQQRASPLPLLKPQRHPKPQATLTAGPELAAHHQSKCAAPACLKSELLFQRTVTLSGPEPPLELDSDEEFTSSLRVLLVDSSMVRDMHISRYNTCHPGASINDAIPVLLCKCPHVALCGSSVRNK